jgi:putative exosortase-associated protein (TIGR04073 family)
MVLGAERKKTRFTFGRIGVSLRRQLNRMRKTTLFLSGVLLAGFLVSGCAGPEAKLGRGVDNTLEVARWGELRRTVEQTAVLDSPDVGYTTGFIAGFDRSLIRTGGGIFDVITFPFPPYDQVPLPRSFAANPVYPDNYKPHLLSDSLFDTDTYIGFSAGDVAPFVPGSRFSIFNN